MGKQQIRMLVGLGMMTFVGACVARVEESPLEAIDEQEMAVDVRLPRWRIIRPNPIDPGGRLFRCLPDLRKTYLAHDPDVCAGIRFSCPVGSAPFFDRCGCGCVVDSFAE
jgi:hypothetical protein